jgi:hypothetical protein
MSLPRRRERHLPTWDLLLLVLAIVMILLPGLLVKGDWGCVVVGCVGAVVIKIEGDRWVMGFTP